MENSELDLYDLFLKAKDAPEIPGVAADMAKELGAGGGDPACSTSWPNMKWP